MTEELEILCEESDPNENCSNKGNKRARCSNFSPQEEDLLLSLVVKYSHILASKQTNAVTWDQKRDAWVKIAKQFGSQSNVYRRAKNLKAKYENIKRSTKQTIATAKKEMYLTGGGQYRSHVKDTDERVAALLGSTASGLQNSVDSDRLPEKNQNVKQESVPCEYEDVEILDEMADDEKENSNTWSSWNPSQLQTKKSPKTVYKKTWCT